MATKLGRKAELPAGVIPLLTMPQLETYYDVSDWTIRQWIEQGMPVEPMAPSRPADPHDSPRQTKNHRRFDLAKVQAWHAERSELAETA